MIQKKIFKVCKYCGKAFQTDKADKVFCSKKCKASEARLRDKVSRGEKKSFREKLAEERRKDMEIVLDVDGWKKRRGFI